MSNNKPHRTHKKQPQRGGLKSRTPTPTTPRGEKARHRRDTLRTIIQTRGLASLDVKTFAREHNVSRTVVYEDLKILADEVGQQGASIIVLSALERLRRADAEYLSILTEAKEVRWVQKDGIEHAMPAVSDNVRLGAAKALAENARAEVDALQRLGLLRGPMALPGDPERPMVVASETRRRLQDLFPIEDAPLPHDAPEERSA